MFRIKIISFLSISICSIVIALKTTDIIHQNLFSCAAIVFGIAAIHATKPSENKKIKQ